MIIGISPIQQAMRMARIRMEKLLGVEIDFIDVPGTDNKKWVCTGCLIDSNGQLIEGTSKSFEFDVNEVIKRYTI